ncbi:Carboxylesterase type B [Penicillium hordei]|jgi:hypothetical protein|uniref:Carboxylesterase type B n=1 Tax=Penicillium hordei TaxID=40994 RepID=A0AAD6DZV3_9EURO|nr:Carboxylesterase type B [Penicillium hordei]KAJ5598035.1 Carboxylesterase type B [Penicillium hordei]
MKPALYLLGTSSVFYNGQGSDSSLNATIVQPTQRQIVQFVKAGNQNAKEDPHVPLYHGQAQVLSLGDDGVHIKPTLTNIDRCTYEHKVEF